VGRHAATLCVRGELGREYEQAARPQRSGRGGEQVGEITQVDEHLLRVWVGLRVGLGARARARARARAWARARVRARARARARVRASG
jgi:hypothetical protein